MRINGHRPVVWFGDGPRLDLTRCRHGVPPCRRAIALAADDMVSGLAQQSMRGGLRHGSVPAVQ